MESIEREDHSKSAVNVEVTSTTPRRSEMFRPAVSSRATVVNRSSTSSYPGYLRPQSQTRHSFAGIPSQQIAEMSSTGVTNFKEERTNEKAELQGLNSRLANYMEKMRYLEAVNKALEKELEKQKKIKDVDFDKIKNMYETELKQARKVIEDLSREKSDADVKVLSLEDEINFVKNERDHEMKDKEDYKNKANNLADQIGDYEGKLTNLRLHIDGLEDSTSKLQNTIKRLQQENARLRTDLDTETVNHINEANRAQGLEEQLAFITQVYEQEIKELQELAKRDTTIEMRDFWKGEMGGALRDIQAEYDSRLNQVSSTLESKYNVQLNQINSNANRDTMEINHIKDESKQFKTKINDLNANIAGLVSQNANLDQRNKQLTNILREKDEEFDNAQLKHDAEMSKMQQNVESVLAELQKLMDAKLSLEMEIVAYRKLLESEEERFDMRSKFENMGGFATANETIMHTMIKGRDSQDGQQKQGQTMPEFTSRLTVNRTSRGGLALDEIAPDGSSITISNKPSTKRRNSVFLKDWTIERYFKDGSPSKKYTFIEDIELKPDTSLCIFSKSFKQKPEAENEIVVDIDNWGRVPADTYLQDNTGAEKASHRHIIQA